MGSGFGGLACACGGVAQLGERLLCKQEVVGSIPSASSCAGACLAGSVVEREGLGFEGWITAVGRGLALEAWDVRAAGGAGVRAVVLYGL